MNSLEQLLLKIFCTTVLISHQKHSVPQQIWLFSIVLFLNLNDKAFKSSDAHSTFLRTETLQSDKPESAIYSLQTVDKFICLLQFSTYWGNVRLQIAMKTRWQDPCWHITKRLVNRKSQMLVPIIFQHQNSHMNCGDCQKILRNPTRLKHENAKQCCLLPSAAWVAGYVRVTSYFVLQKPKFQRNCEVH